MPDPTSDATLDSSTSIPSTSTAEGADAALSNPSSDSQTTDTRSASGTDQSAVDTAKSATATAIDFLSNGTEADGSPKPTVSVDKTEKENPTKDPAPAKPAAKDQAKPADEKPADATKDDTPFAEFTPEEQKRLSFKTRQRIETLHKRWKETEAQLPTLKQQAERGSVFESVLKEHGVDRDLADLDNDGDVAASIRFQAARNRLAGGRGTRADLSFVQAVIGDVVSSASQFGVPLPQAAAPQIEAVEKVIADAEKAFRLDPEDATALRAALKTQATAAPAPAVAAVPPSVPQVRLQAPPAPAPVPQQPADPYAGADVAYWSARAEQQIAASGVSDVRGYFTKQVWPQVLQSLSKMFPGQDPVAAYRNISPQSRHSLVVETHAALQKQIAPSQPDPAPRTSTPRPVSGSGTRQPMASAPQSGIAAAINFLSNG